MNITRPPKVTVRVGSPVELKHRNPDTDTTTIMKAIMELLPAESRKKITPTAEQIARANPSGAQKKNTVEAEAVRRPGTD